MRSQTHLSIILKAYDVGDADRFLILFTKERGLLSARAKGVRKLKSKMGGHLLAPNIVKADLTETSSSFIVTGAERISKTGVLSFSQFQRAMQGIELLLALLHEDEPIEELFDANVKFLHYCTETERNPVLPFVLQTLSILGLLPETSDQRQFGKLSHEEAHFIEHCRNGAWEQAKLIPEQSKILLLKRCLAIAESHASKPLRQIAA